MAASAPHHHHGCISFNNLNSATGQACNGYSVVYIGSLHIGHFLNGCAFAGNLDVIVFHYVSIAELTRLDCY